MTLYAIGIVGHIARESMATVLAEDIKATCISIDPGHIGPGTNHRRVWAELSTYDTTWSVVIEDDALPVTGFRDQLALVLDAAPAPIVSLYLGRKRPPNIQQRIVDGLDRIDHSGAHWLIHHDLLHAVGVAVRTELVADMVTHTKAFLPIDQSIGVWARRNGHEIAYTVPSLLDHRDTDTLVQHPDGVPRTPGRIAWDFGSRPSWNSRSISL